MDVAIKNHIESSILELAGRLYPGFTTDITALSVAYTCTTVSGGHVKQSQMELKIIGPDYDECKAIEGKLLDLLDMDEDEPFVVAEDIRFHSSIAGGGYLFNDGCQMHEVTQNFVIDWRKIS